MINTIALGICLLILAAAVPIIVSLARRALQLAEQVIEVDQVSEERRKTIDSQADTLERQRDTIDLLSERNGELEDRNACLERVQRRNVRQAIMAMPVVRWTDPEGEVRQISMN